MSENMVITIDGKQYPLATTLRVAYVVQGQYNHKPYAEIFKDIGNMGVEQQVNIIYAAFKCANPEDAKVFTSQKFLDYCLDNFNLKDLMVQLQAVIKGIMGEDVDSNEVEEDITALGETAKGN